jgi:REP element-mobilizing transposase RayT
MKGPPVWLAQEQVDALAEQFKETSRFRGWIILAGAVMSNHVHLVVGVPGDPDPDKLLGDYKAWGTRRLNTQWGKRPNGTWWADGGSKRKLPREESVWSAIAYVLRQAGALRIWIAKGWEPPEDVIRLGGSPVSRRTALREQAEATHCLSRLSFVHWPARSHALGLLTQGRSPGPGTAWPGRIPINPAGRGAGQPRPADARPFA